MPHKPAPTDAKWIAAARRYAIARKAFVDLPLPPFDNPHDRAWADEETALTIEESAADELVALLEREGGHG